MEPRQECPKCHHVRQPGDTTPPWQCPNCGIAYDKFIGARPDKGDDDIKDDAVPRRRDRFKAIRIFILSLILIFVATDTWLTRMRTTSWDHPLRVVVYPINADGSEAAADYIAHLEEAQFDDIEQTMKRQASRYGITIDEPVNIALSDPVVGLPPPQPHDNNIFKVIRWSLSLRLWANRKDNYQGPTPEIRAFTLYYDPKTHPVLEHSTGLEKGMIGVIKLFASNKMTAENNVVMLHELLHTLGATDKYDLNTDQPIYPDGYAEPELQPLLPQHLAEIMAGRIPISENRAKIPASLAEVVIGPKTAREIGWIK